MNDESIEDREDIDPDQIPYSQFAGSQDVPPPYFFPNVRVNTFIWPADTRAIQKYCDENFNLGPASERGFKYRAAAFWPYVMLQFLEYPDMISATTKQVAEGETPFSDRGITAQKEVFIALPVVRYGRGLSGLLTESALEFALPFIVVSKPWSSVCGREMLGLGKLLAEIRLEEGDYPKSFRAHASLPGWRMAEEDCPQEILPYIDVKTGPTLPTFRHNSGAESTLATLVDNRAAEWTIQNLASLSNFTDQASLGLFPTAMRTVGLKQYRDAVDPSMAVYQALVTCRTKYSNVRELRLYNEADVHITFHPTGNFAELISLLFSKDYGDEAEGIQPKVAAAFRFEADIDFDDMNVIHQFEIRGENGDIVRPRRSYLTAPWFRPIKGFFNLGHRP